MPTDKELMIFTDNTMLVAYKNIVEYHYLGSLKYLRKV